MFTVNLKPNWVHLTPDVTYPIDYSPNGKSYYTFEDGEICIRDSYYTHGVNGFRKKNDQQLSVALSKAILTVLGYAETLNKTTFIALSMEFYRFISSYMYHCDNEQETFNIRSSFESLISINYSIKGCDCTLLSSNFYYICKSFVDQYKKGFISENYKMLKELNMLIDDGDKHICTPPHTYTEISDACTRKEGIFNVPINEDASDN